jgi:O-antigen/teichoic acid export membrane protein
MTRSQLSFADANGDIAGILRARRQTMKKLPALSPTSWLTTKTVFSQVFAILLFVIQAPVLGPRAFGLISIVMVFVGFCETVLGEAVSESLISIRQIDTSHFDTMNTVNVLVSLLCGLVVFLGADTAARWFGDAELAPIMRVMSVLPVISSLTAAPTGYTKREMQFQPLALRSMASLFVGGIIGLVLTLMRYGVWALVWQALSTRLMATIVLWMAVPLRLRFGVSRKAFMELCRFALPTLLSRAMSWGTSQFPRLIFGLYWGPTELGLFGLAARLCDILLDVTLVPRYVVARVELRQFAADPVKLQEAARQVLMNMSTLAFPLCIGGAAVVPTLFHAWLDARWYGGMVPAELMMLMCVPFVTHYCAGAILLAGNFQSAEALLSIVQTVITVAAVLIFAPLGLLPATAAFAARPLVTLPLPVRLVRIKAAVPARVLLDAQKPALIAATLMGVGVTAVRVALEPYLRSILLLPLLVAVGAAIYGFVISLLLPGFVRQFLARLSPR